MNILYLIWQDAPGGIEVLLPQIISHMPQHNFSVCVLKQKHNNTPSVFENSNMRVNYLANNKVFLYIKLFFFIKKYRANVIHGFNLGPFILFILRLARAKYIIYSIHGTIYWKTRLQKIIRKIFWAISLTPEIIFLSNSNYSKNVFLKKISQKVDIKVLYNPFDTNRFFFVKQNEFDKDRLKIFYCGRLVKGKNLFKWINIAEKILEVNNNFVFNIYGEGPLKREIDDYIKNKNLVNKVILHGFKNDVENVYKENDLLLFLSEYESFGNVAVESILCGTPVIVSDIPAMKEIFKDYPEFVVPLDKNLEKNVLLKIKELDRLKLSALRAAEDFKVRFSMEKHNLELEKIYNSFE